jgi:hypothetical protein
VWCAKVANCATDGSRGADFNAAEKECELDFNDRFVNCDTVTGVIGPEDECTEDIYEARCSLINDGEIPTSCDTVSFQHD